MTEDRALYSVTQPGSGESSFSVAQALKWADTWGRMDGPRGDSEAMIALAAEVRRLQFQLARTEEALLAAQSDARSAWSSCRAADKDIDRLRADMAARDVAIIEIDRQLQETGRQKVALLTASQAVTDRWHSPLWKDVPATAGYIQRLEQAVREVVNG